MNRKYHLDDRYFETIDSEEKAYWLGFLAGDGSITNDGGTTKIRLCLAGVDLDHLNKYKKAVGWTGRTNISRGKYFTVGFRSKLMAEDLEKYTITERKTFTVRFPEIEKDLERHFIRGVFDADGCIYIGFHNTARPSGKKYRYVVGEFPIGTNDLFTRDLYERFIEIGLPKTSMNYTSKKISRIRWSGCDNLSKIYKFLYDDSNIFLERKERKLLEFISMDASGRIAY